MGRKYLKTIFKEYQLMDVPAQWIPVEEPPKKHGQYLVNIKNSIEPVQIRTFSDEGNWCLRDYEEITHWRERPAPPKEQEGE